MANLLDVSALTLNPQEETDLRNFIFEAVFMNPDLSIHTVQSGVTMKQQIVFAGKFGKTGIKGDATCTRKTSGEKIEATQKYWEPAGIEDTFTHCQAEVNSLFKPFFARIQKYIDRYEVSDMSDQARFIASRVLESIQETMWRAVWLGDTAVAAAGAAAVGLVDAANVKFYDYFNGLWKQIFAGVTAGDIARVTITENTALTNALRTTLAAGRSIQIFDAMWALADSRLRSATGLQLLVSREIFDNYKIYLRSISQAFTLEQTTEGFNSLMWEGVRVVNMENVWDRNLRADFVEDTTDNLYYLPNRAVLTVPENIAIATLNQSDLTALESWYERKERENNVAYGFNLDAKVLEEYMIVAAY